MTSRIDQLTVGTVLLAVVSAACGERRPERPEIAPAETLAAPRGDIAAAEGTGAGETVGWTNDRSRLSGDKLANFTPFTFRYPTSWTVLEDGSGETPNFVKIERASESGITVENFAVGWYAGAGPDDVIAMIEPQFASSFPNYDKVADETTLIAGATSKGFRFQAVVETPGGPVTFWGRALARPVEPTRGILLVMFASQLAPGVENAGDIGRKGELPVILESFRIGEEQR